MLNFAESGRHIFRATSALERGELRSRGEGMKSNLFFFVTEQFLGFVS